MSDTTAASIRYDSVTDVTAIGERHELHDDVSDMLALERRMRESIAAQTKMDAASPEAQRIIARLEIMTDVHIEVLEKQLAQLGGSSGSAAKSMISAFLGAGAAALGTLRSQKLSQALRDDYAALSLASISYTMLYTVALGYGDGSTAALARSHLSDTASIVTELSRVMPSVVLQELLDEGHSIPPNVKRTALLNTHDAWSDSGT